MSTGFRVPLALHIPQSALPPTSAVPATTTPVQHLTTSAVAQDYDLICVPLTNDLWRERWERLCLRPLEQGDEDIDEAGEGAKEWIERERRRAEVEKEAELWRLQGGFRRGELNVTRLEETERLVVLASAWLELDSPDEGIRFDSELALRQELLLAIHLSIPYFVCPSPNPENRENLPSFARAIASLLELGGEGSQTRILVRIGVSDRPPVSLNGPNGYPYQQGSGTGSTPSFLSGPPPAHITGQWAGQQPEYGQMTKAHKRRSSMGPGAKSGPGSYGGVGQGQAAGPASGNRASTIGLASTGDQNSFSWEVWDCIRTLCGYHPRLSLALDLSNPLPPSLATLGRWIAEPTQLIFLPSQAFIPNAKGYPVLSKACQGFVKGFVKLKPTIVLSSTNTTKHPSGGSQGYIQYIRHLESSVNGISNLNTSTYSSTANATSVTDSAKASGMQSYMDWLQAPLQPLMDDLGSATYEVFERDPVKYRLYEEAVFQALNDRPDQGTTVIYVVGAGRGPLVSGCKRAAKRASRQVRIYAVEKNANAFVTLQEKRALEWGESVQILFGDMRTIEVPEPADIMVSELLGSFGDNELSPECLDGAGRSLKPEGISIPASYSAHLAPLSSSKLFAEVQSHSGKKGKTLENVVETPYVVMFQQVNLLSGNPIVGEGTGRCGGRVQECWSFEHPRRDMVLDNRGLPMTNSHNTRSAHLTFRIPHAGALHGLAGYFEAHLYGNVGLSIHPERMDSISPEMMSWFPLFFPLKEPLYLPSGAELDVYVWRLTDPRSRKVWYEWQAESFLPITGFVNGVSSLSPNPNPSSSSSFANGTASRNVSMTSASGGAPQPSPMMDAPQSPMPAGTFVHGNSSNEARIKIGQTTLHNPGGRSSWIGL